MKLFTEHPLARKMAILVAFKMAVLFMLWWAFFSEPQDAHLSADDVGSAILHPATRSNPNP